MGFRKFLTLLVTHRTGNCCWQWSMCEVYWAWCSAGEVGHSAAVGAAVVVQVVQTVNKEEKLSEVEQRSQDSYHRRKDSRAFSLLPCEDYSGRGTGTCLASPVCLIQVVPCPRPTGCCRSKAALGEFLQWPQRIWELLRAGVLSVISGLPIVFLPIWQGCCLCVPARVRNGLALSKAGSQVPQSVGGSSSVPPPAPVAKQADAGVCPGAQAWLWRVQIPTEP